MKIITRIRPENDAQKCYVLEFNSIYGNTKLETFLTDKEVNKYVKAGIIVKVKE